MFNSMFDELIEGKYFQRVAKLKQIIAIVT